jgi:UTP-glucose-1-phosphate uridylyltransferase
MEINGPDISKYDVIVLNNETRLITGQIDTPNFESETSNIASTGRYVFTLDIFDILRNQLIGVTNEIQFADTINTQAVNNIFELYFLMVNILIGLVLKIKLMLLRM